MVRRTRSLGALVLAMAVVAAACGGGDDGDDDAGASGELPDCPVDALDDADGPVEITLWHAQIAQSEVGLQQMVDEYNASQDRVVVDVQSQGVADEELERAYDQAVAGDDLPQITLALDTQTRSLADSETILPATACIEADDYDTADLVEAEMEHFSVDGTLYPGSIMPATGLLFYNRAHFEEAGLDPDDPPGTLAEIREAAEAIKDAGVVDEPFVYSTVPFVFEYWLTGAQIPFVNEGNGRDGEPTEAAWSEPGTVEILELLQGMNDDGLMNAIANTPGSIDQFLAMASPDPATRGSMLLETSNAATSIEAFLRGELDPGALTDDQRVVVDDDLDLDLDLDAAPFAGLEAPGRVQAGGWGFFMVDRGSDAEKAAAWDFATYANTVEAQQTLSLVAGMDPFNLQVADQPEVQEVWETTLSGSWVAISYQQMLDIDLGFPGPLVGPFTEMRDIEGELLDSVVLDGADPQDALDEASAQLTAALEAYEDQSF